MPLLAAAESRVESGTCLSSAHTHTYVRTWYIRTYLYIQTHTYTWAKLVVEPTPWPAAGCSCQIHSGRQRDSTRLLHCPLPTARCPLPTAAVLLGPGPQGCPNPNSCLHDTTRHDTTHPQRPFCCCCPGLPTRLLHRRRQARSCSVRHA